MQTMCTAKLFSFVIILIKVAWLIFFSFFVFQALRLGSADNKRWEEKRKKKNHTKSMEKQSNKEELQLMIMPERPTKSAQMLNIYGENPNEKKSETKTSLELS